MGEIAYTFADVESTKHNSSAAVQPNANCQGNNLKFKKKEKKKFRNETKSCFARQLIPDTDCD